MDGDEMGGDEDEIFPERELIDGEVGLWYREISGLLKATTEKDPDQAFIRRYLGTPRQVLGCTSDAMRMIAREVVKANPAWGDDEWLALLDRLFAGSWFEHRAMAGILLGRLAPLRQRLDLATLRRWLAGPAGWAEVDITCQSSFTEAEMLARWDEWAPFLAEINGAEPVSLRRASLVLLVGALRSTHDPRLVERALANVTARSHEKEGMITKAISWALRALAVSQPDIVRGYLDAHGGQLPAVAVRETRIKLETGRKSKRTTKDGPAA
jgi:3-methyladenine DNA glycosylase AlkD